VIVRAGLPRVFVVAIVVQLVAVDVLVAWAAMHHALSSCARNGSANCSNDGADRPSDYRADDTAGYGARRGGPTSSRVLVAIVCALTMIVVPR
jgi:hypothetical protein